MNRVDVRELSAYVGTPSITILISFAGERHRVEHLTHMVGKARAELKARYPAASTLFPEIYVIESQVDITRPQGLMVCINSSIIRVYELAFEVEDRIVIDSFFATNIVEAPLNRTDRFWLLLIHKEIPYLFEGHETMAFELVHRHSVWQGEEELSVDDAAGKVCPYHWDSSCRYLDMKSFIQRIDDYLQHFIASDPVPLVVVSNKETRTAFEKYSSLQQTEIIYVQAPLTPLSPEQLHGLVIPKVQAFYARLTTEGLRALKRAREAEAHIVAEDPRAIWNALREDRVRYICVERTLTLSGCEDRALDAVRVQRVCDVGQPIDLIDQIIGNALSKNIPVLFYEQGKLSFCGGIAAVLSE